VRYRTCGLPGGCHGRGLRRPGRGE
jgi:hypothetical protein